MILIEFVVVSLTMNKIATALITFISILCFSFQGTAQDEVLIIYNSSWGANGTFNCVQDYAGTNGNFTLCPMPNGALVAAPACVNSLCTYDVIMVQATYSSLNAAFINQLIAYLQCGGNLFFQNDVGSGSQAQAQQNMNDLLAAIGQAPIILGANLGTFPNQQPIINTGTSGLTNLCTISPLHYASGGVLSGAGLANAATVDISIGTIAAFWQTGFGGVLGLGGEFYTSGNWAGTCLPGSGEMVWNFMTTVNPGCLTILADFTPSSFSICENETLDMIDASVSDSIIAWDWVFAGGVPGTSTLQNPVGISYANAGTYDITLTITDSSGVTDDTTLQIVVAACNPTADFAVIDTICAGTPFTVTDASTSPSGILTWDWVMTGGTPAASILQNPGNIAYNLPGSYDITLTVTDATGSDDTTLTVVVIDCSPPIASFSIPNDTICLSECFTPTDLSTFTLPLTNWDWSFAGGSPAISNTQNPGNICFANAGVYDLTLIVTDSMGSTDDTTIQVFVQDCSPTASFNVIDTICMNAPLNVNDMSFSLMGIQTWDWTFTGGTPGTSNLQAPGNITYSAIGTYNINLSVSNAFGVDDTTISIVVIDCGPPTSVFSIPNDTICFNDCFTPTDLSFSVFPIDTWAWTFTGGVPATSNTQNPGNICYPNPGLYDITLTITDTSGTTDDTTIQVFVENCQLPFASFSVIDTICEGIALNVNDLSTSVTPILSWSWDIPGGTPSTSNVQNPGNIIYSTAGTYDITLTVTNVLGNDDTTITVVVVDCGPPLALFSIPNDTLCPGDCVTPVEMSTSESPITSWAWDFGAGSPASSDLQNPGTVCFATSGTHPITLTVTNVNGSHDTTFYVVVQSPPNASFTINPYNPVTDEIVNFIDQSAGAVTWLWNIDGVIYTTENPTGSYPETGTYPVSLTVTSSAGCTDTITGSFSIAEELIYYVPNAFTPDGDEFNQTFKPIFYSGFDPFDYNFIIFNRWGEIVFETNDPDIGWDGTYGNSTQLVQDGIYVWRIEFKLLENDERRVINGHVNILR